MAPTPRVGLLAVAVAVALASLHPAGTASTARNTAYAHPRGGCDAARGRAEQRALSTAHAPLGAKRAGARGGGGRGAPDLARRGFSWPRSPAAALPGARRVASRAAADRSAVRAH